MARGVIRYWAAARDAAGTAAEPYDAPNLAAALAAALALRAERGVDTARLERVLGMSSFVVDGDPVGGRAHEQVPLAEGGVIEVLPPFAGG
jgi:sulfur-carrier protein